MKRSLWLDIIICSLIAFAMGCLVGAVIKTASSADFGPDKTCRADDNFRKIPCDFYKRGGGD